MLDSTSGQNSHSCNFAREKSQFTYPFFIVHETHKVYTYTTYFSAIARRAAPRGKTAVLSGFCKIEHGALWARTTKNVKKPLG